MLTVVRKISIIFLLVLQVFLVIPSMAFAETEDWGDYKGQTGWDGGAAGGKMSMPLSDDSGWVMTSAYGNRVHPITGQWHHHSGIDFGADYGTPVLAACGGLVVSDCDLGDGYGNAVVIDTGAGLIVRYGHLQRVYVSNGQTVETGTPLGEVGSTGNSTGPHLHFEIRKSGPHLYGETLDPGLFLGPRIEQMEIEKFGIMEGGGDAGSFATDFDSSDVSLEVSADFAKPMKEFIDGLIEVLTNAMDLVKDNIYKLFFVLATIDLAVAAMYKGLGAWGTEDDTTFVNWFIYKIIFYVLMVFILSNFNTFIGNLALYGFPELGVKAINSTDEAVGAAVSDPTAIIQKGLEIIAPIINESLKVHGFFDLFTKNVTNTICLIFGLLLLICFILIAIQIMLAYLYFYFTVLFAFTNFMLSGLRWTRKYASNGINGIFASSLNLMFFCIFSVLVQQMMANLAVGPFIETKTTVTEIGATTEIQSVEEAMVRIKCVESTGNYDVYNYEGSGAFGAYQQMPQYWDGRCQNYVDAGGTLCLTSDGDSYPDAPNTYYSWCNENQDKVSRYMLEGYYNEYGSWNEAVRCWVGGPGARHSGSADEYLAKCLNADGSGVSSSTVTNIALLFKLLALCVFMILLGDHMMKLINKTFGGMGFKLTNEQ